jgi:sigma-54 dependent transcriptional regulator, acetoin dehydrogenase operon transcriptional activator AcoR
MMPNRIASSGTLLQEIKKSHERSKQFGIDPNSTCNHDQVRLTPVELESLRHENADYYQIALSTMRDLYEFFRETGFVMAITDHNGYILDTMGDPPVLDWLASRNLVPGFRWTEQDVGTSAISLAHACKIPVQINDKEHYCKRGYGHTSSASPIFSPDDKLAGIIVLSGDAHKVHHHTLGMVVMAAKAIEHRLYIIKSAKEIQIRNSYMNAIIESIDSGIMAIDQNGSITQINSLGGKILPWDENLSGKAVQPLLSLEKDWKQLVLAGDYVDREVFVKGPRKTIQLIATIKSICESGEGFIVIFNEINRIRKLIHKMAGLQALFTFDDIIGNSAALVEAKRLAKIAAAGKSNVLLLGETGTGKELFAQAIHNYSERKGKPFLAINCGAIPRELIESELFGYADGAFTGAQKGGRPGKFELTNGGTVLLDEIGNTPTDMQVKLLRVLQSGEIFRIGQHKPIPVDVRIIAATHVNLKKEIEKGNFREDLYYRLNVFPIALPPLRNRREDIIILAHHILNRASAALGRPDVRFSQKAEQALMDYHWPGNVRELGNIVERAVNLLDGAIIEVAHLGIQQAIGKKAPAVAQPSASLDDVERETIRQTMAFVGNNIARTAGILGITRATLYKKLEKHQISREK